MGLYANRPILFNKTSAVIVFKRKRFVHVGIIFAINAMEWQLIKAVKKRPTLYKRTSIQFKSKKHRDSAWLEVSKDVGVPVEACRTRWKSLRDRFVRENTKLLNESGGGVVDPSRCAWEFYEPLLYIEDEIKLRGNYNTFQSTCCTRYSRIDRFVVNAVKDHPLLYDSNQRLFRNILERQQAWCKVSQRVGRSLNYHLYRLAERCRKGWRAVRDRYITNKLEGQCDHMDMMDFIKNHTDNIVDSDDDEYTWPKEELFEAHPHQHSYVADTSAQDSFTAESGDECTYASREPPNKSFTEVFIESDDANELPTSSNAIALKHQKVMEATEKFETLVGTLNNFVERRIEKENDKSRNYEYYKVLDRYLQKMSDDEQDKVKAEILKMVFNHLGH